jgi:hypothetical protein
MEEERSRLSAYFRILRQQVNNCPIPSRFQDELVVIAESALNFSDPIPFLLKFGIVFFGDCCALKLTVLAKAISSSRSRLWSALQREQWQGLAELTTRVGERITRLGFDARAWSVREYPTGSRIEIIVRENPKLTVKPPPGAGAKLGDMHDAAELTLHVDIFSWTGFDEPWPGGNGTE